MENRKKIRSASGFFGWIGLTLLSAFIVALGVTYFFLTNTMSGVSFPQNWWFPPVNIAYIWFSFYTLKGISAWIIWRKMGTVILGGPINWYISHLLASILATFLMFFLPVSIGLFTHALVIALTFFVTFLRFYKKNNKAGLILIPNFIWLIYILMYYGLTVLNTYLW